MAQVPQCLLQNLNRAQLLLLVLTNRLGRNHLLWNARVDEDVIVLGDLDAALFGVELTDAGTLAHLTQLELLGLIARELDHVEPGHRRTFLSVRLQQPRWPVEKALEAVDEDGSQGTGTQIDGHALVPFQDASIVGQRRDERGEGVILRDEGEVVVVLTGEVVDLEMGRGGGLFARVGGGGLVGVAPLPLELRGRAFRRVQVQVGVRGGLHGRCARQSDGQGGKKHEEKS